MKAMRRPSIASSRAGCVRPRRPTAPVPGRLADQAVDHRPGLPRQGEQLQNARDPARTQMTGEGADRLATRRDHGSEDGRTVSWLVGGLGDEAVEFRLAPVRPQRELGNQRRDEPGEGRPVDLDHLEPAP